MSANHRKPFVGGNWKAVSICLVSSAKKKQILLNNFDYSFEKEWKRKE
jgi:hypothetical protein